MSNKKTLNKLLPVWIAISAVLILAGMVLLGILDFNYKAELPQSKTVEVEYGVVTQISENGEEELKELCGKAISDKGVSYSATVQEQVDSQSFSKVMPKKIVYTLSGDVSNETLASLAEAVKTATASYFENDGDFTVYTHDYQTEQNVYFENYWRGGLAIGVSVFVALIYVGIRFGVGSALTGLTMCANDALLTVSVLTITRIPVYFYSPLVYAMTAALVSVILWIFQCMKMKENFKTPEFATLSADEVIAKSRKTSYLLTVIFGASLALIVLIASALATVGSRLFFLPMLLPVVLPLYSSLVFGPALHVHVKTAFDKWKEKHGGNKNKKKAAKPVEAES